MLFEYINIVRIILLLIIISIAGSIFYYIKIKHNKSKLTDNITNYNVKDFFGLKQILLGISFVLVCICILGPRGGIKEEIAKSNGIDIVIVLDVSKSMYALDFKDSKYIYSRLAASKNLISNFMKDHTQDRFGLVIFAGEAISISPLTKDANIFLTFLQGVDSNNLTEQGTNLHDAIMAGVSRFDQDSQRSKALLLISDGGDENTVENLQSIQKSIKENNVSVYTIGIGSLEGNFIPEGQDVFGNISYKTFQGSKVVSKLNEKQLKTLAQNLNGQYIRAQSLNDLNKANNELDKLEKQLLEEEFVGDRKDLTRIFVGLSLAFFIMYFLIIIYEKSDLKLDLNLLINKKGKK